MIALVPVLVVFVDDIGIVGRGIVMTVHIIYRFPVNSVSPFFKPSCLRLQHSAGHEHDPLFLPGAPGGHSECLSHNIVLGSSACRKHVHQQGDGQYKEDGVPNIRCDGLGH